MRYPGIRIQNISLSSVGQGCMGVGGRFLANTIRDTEQVRALKAGIDLGMTFVDTAEAYGAGHSEELVGHAIKGCRERVFIASKVSPEHLRARDLISACEKSLQRLGIEELDLYQIHWPNPSVPLEETLETMVHLRKQGKIRHIGLSNFSLPEIKNVQQILYSVPLFSVQSEYNLFERGAEQDIIPWCSQNDVLFIAYSPLDQGRVVGSARVRDCLAEISNRIGISISQIALNFLSKQGQVLTIPKATHLDHIQKNASACDFTLPDEVYEEINRNCRVNVIPIPGNRIRPAVDSSGEHHVYTTIEEAKINAAGHSPSPLELAEDIKKDDRIKPIRVTPITRCCDQYRYDLVEGRLRFWAWVLAFDGKRDVPVLVRD